MPKAAPTFNRTISHSTTTARFAPGTRDRAEHLKDGEDFLRDIAAGTLPHVAFYKPVGVLTQHPMYTDLASGDAHVDDVLNRLRASPQWAKMLVIVIPMTRMAVSGIT